MKNYIAIILVLIVVLSSCHSTKKTMTAESIVAKMQYKYPNYTVASLKQGRTLYQQNCGTCHELKNPSSFTEEQWKKTVPPMCDKVNEKKTILSKKDEALILKYVVSIMTVSSQK